MLSRIRIQGFQAHEDLKLKLDPHITTIVGPTDAGKSSIIRAIRWALLNKPRGEFTNHHMDNAIVKVWLTSGETITRQRGKEGNLYLLDDQQFTAFSSSVPGPIEELLKVSDLNFQGQHDPSYWLTSSPGDVARQLNSIIDLDVIDTAQKSASTVLRSAKTMITVVEDRLSELQTDYDALDWVTFLEADLVRLERQERAIASDVARVALLADMVTKVRAAKQTHQQAAQTLSGAGGALKALLAQNKDIRDLLDRRTTLYRLLNDLADKAARVADLDQQIIDMQAHIDLAVEEEKVCPECQRPL